jgi:hypothetical protein
MLGRMKKTVEVDDQECGMYTPFSSNSADILWTP